MDERDQIEKVLRDFDWRRLWNIMQDLDLEWKVGGEWVVPTEDEARETARDLLGGLDEVEGNVSVESGGLVARRSDGVISLHFEPLVAHGLEE